MVKTLYDIDVAAWSEEQAAILRCHSEQNLDWDNLAEEIEAVGISQKREVYSRLKLICQHLLKWQYQRALRSRSWRATIRTQRRDLARVLRQNPSLRREPYILEELAEAYIAAREDATDETGIDRFPLTCPYPLNYVLDPDSWPGGSEL